MIRAKKVIETCDVLTFRVVDGTWNASVADDQVPEMLRLSVIPGYIPASPAFLPGGRLIDNVAAGGEHRLSARVHKQRTNQVSGNIVGPGRGVADEAVVGLTNKLGMIGIGLFQRVEDCP